MALTPAQQAYYNQLVNQPGQGTPDEIMKYVSGLSDIQARASTAADSYATGAASSIPSWVTSSDPGAYQAWLTANNLPPDVLTQTVGGVPLTSSGQTYTPPAASTSTGQVGGALGPLGGSLSGGPTAGALGSLAGPSGTSGASQFTDQQVQQAYLQLLQQGDSNPDILRAAYNMGIGPDQMIRAVQSYNPSAFSGDALSTMQNYVRQQYAGFGTQPGSTAGGSTGGGAPGTPGGSIPPAGGTPGTPGAPATPGGAGSSNLGFGSGFQFSSNPFGNSTAPTLQAVGNSPNPYLQQQANEVARQSGLALQNDLNGIRSDSIGIGGLGGSRQGVAQGVATGRAMDSLQGNLANLYGTDYTNQANRNLQQFGQDSTNYNAQRAQDLALYGTNMQGALGLNGQNQNFYTSQRGQDLAQTALGAQLYGQGNAGFLSQGSGLQDLGNTQQTAAQQNLNNFSNVLNQFTGFGGQTIGTNAGGGTTGTLGGALAGNLIGTNLGFGTTTNANAPGGVNTTGFGTGAMFGNQDIGQFI